MCGENGMLEPEHLGLAVGRAAGENSAAPATGDILPAINGAGEPLTLADLEKRHILAALERCKGNRTHAAKMLAVSIRTLRNKLHEYNGTSPKPDDERESVEN